MNIRPLSAADVPAVIDFNAAIFDSPPERLASSYRAMWEQNPYFDESTDLRGFVAEDEQGLAGVILQFPGPLQYEGRELRIVYTSSWAVNERGRTVAMKLLLKQVQLCRDTVLVSTTPGAVSMKTLQALKFKPVPHAGEEGLRMPAWHFVLSPGLFARQYKPLRKLGPFARVALHGWRSVQLRHLARKLRPPLCVRFEDRPPAELDDLWQRTRQQWPNTVPRTAALVGLYLPEHAASQRLLFSAWEGERMVGYVVVMLKTMRAPVLFIADLWHDETVQGVVPALLNRVIRYGLSDGARSSVVVPAFSDSIVPHVTSLGFFRHPSQQIKGGYMKYGRQFDSLADPHRTCIPYLFGDRI